LSDGHAYTLTFDDAAAQQFDYDGNTIDDLRRDSGRPSDCHNKHRPP
jgi:hypothetical protein